MQSYTTPSSNITQESPIYTWIHKIFQELGLGNLQNMKRKRVGEEGDGLTLLLLDVGTRAWIWICTRDGDWIEARAWGVLISTSLPHFWWCFSVRNCEWRGGWVAWEIGWLVGLGTTQSPSHEAQFLRTPNTSMLILKKVANGILNTLEGVPSSNLTVYEKVTFWALKTEPSILYLN